MRRSVSVVVVSTIAIILAVGFVVSVFRIGGDYSLSPDWSPTDDRIIFECYRPSILEVVKRWIDPRFYGDVPYSPQWAEICLVDENEGSRIVLTTNRYIDQGPVFSPDGNLIAFISNRHGARDGYIMSDSGKNPRRLTEVDSVDDIDWAPSGKRIAFARIPTTDKQSVDSGILVVSIESSSIEVIAEGENRMPSWSPDGNALAYISNQDAKGTTCKLHVIELLNDEEMTNPVEAFCYSKPSWSPIDNSVAFIGPTNEDVENALYLLDLDQEEITQLTSFNWGVDNPTWSKDGDRIYYLAEGEIHMIKVERDISVRIVDLSDAFAQVFIADRNLVLSSAGNKLGFVRAIEGVDKVGIWVVNIDGTDLRLIHP